MGSLAERAVHQAVHAVLDADEKLASAVLDEENTINELQIEIDDRVVQLLALQQLMAADLRFVLAIARINNDLERMGDQAVNIAQSAQRIVRHPRVKPYVDLPRMGELAEKMMRDSLDSLVRRDVELARSVLSRDDQVDQLRDQIFRELLTYMMGDSSVVYPAFELILVAKNLERIADHATNVAEDVSTWSPEATFAILPPTGILLDHRPTRSRPVPPRRFGSRSDWIRVIRKLELKRHYPQAGSQLPSGRPPGDEPILGCECYRDISPIDLPMRHQLPSFH